MAGGAHQEKPISLFYSYSHRDEASRGELEAHLSFLRRSKLIAEWHDRMIGAGDDWKGQIDRQLAVADIILLLVSADFIASEYCWGEEMAKALARHQLGESRVIPVILRPCRWQSTPLGSLQAVPKDGKPVSDWANRDAAFNEIAAAIERTIADLQQQRRRAAEQIQQEARKRQAAEEQQREAQRRREQDEARRPAEAEAVRVPKTARNNDTRGRQQLKMITAVGLVVLVGFAGVVAWQQWQTGKQGTPAVTQTAPTVQPKLCVSNIGGKIQYTGVVGDDKTRGSILTSLRNVFGEGNVSGDIAVDPKAGPATWLGKLDQALEKFKIPGVEALFEGNSISVGGLLPKADLNGIKASLQSIFGTGYSFGALSNDASVWFRAAKYKTLGALSGLKPGFTADDVVSALNLSIINFDTGSAAIRNLLAKAAPVMKQLPVGTVIEIGGHTDSTGDPAANLALSQQRAEAVRMTLIELGVPADMLNAKGYGDTQPVGSNDTAEGRLQNRRISFAVVQAARTVGAPTPVPAGPTVFAPTHADIPIAVVGPMTGQYATFGTQLKAGAEQAVADINKGGGVLGQKLVLEIGDDACDQKQAVAVANQVAAKGVKLVAGHFCSGSSIPASHVYAEENVVQISPASTNPKLTEAGKKNVFRTTGRDDQQGAVAGNYIADHFAGEKIAIVHDKQAYSKGLADETKKQLNARGIKETLYETITPGEKDYSALVSKLKQAGIDVLYYGGYHTEAGLITRQMREQGMSTRMISGDDLMTEEYWSITGPLGEGTMMTFIPDPRKNPAAASVVQEFRAKGIEPEGWTLYTYGAIQAWADAVKAAGSTDTAKVINKLSSGTFETVLGPINFDAKGDVKAPGYVVYVWKDGKYDYAQ